MVELWADFVMNLSAASWSGMTAAIERFLLSKGYKEKKALFGVMIGIICGTLAIVVIEWIEGFF